MNSLMASSGNNITDRRSPYILAIASHKGGTGRTTAALALAWHWSLSGHEVTLLDADPIQAATLIAADPTGHCRWPHFHLLSRFSAAQAPTFRGDIVVVDCPSLTEPAAQRVLALADGVILCCLAEPLALWSIPAATAAIQTGQTKNPRLELVGVLLPMVDDTDEIQSQMLSQVRDLHGGLLLEPVVPYQKEIRDWPLRPGSGLPQGAASRAYAALAKSLRELIRSNA